MRSPEELGLIATIADDLAAGIWVATVPEGRFAYANRAFEEIMGTGGLDVGAGEYSEPYGIYDREGALYREDRLPFVLALQKKSTVVVDDLVIHRGDGRRVYVRAHGKPLFDAQGEMTHIAIAFFDITPEVKAQEARRQAEDRLHRVVANAPVVLYTFDVDGIVTFVEGRALEQLGAVSDLLGKSVFQLYPATPLIHESCLRALAGETVSFVAEVGANSYDARITPMRNEAGEITGAIGVSTDVTDRRRVELQLAQAERLASVGMLAAGVAHEVNNPLAFLMGNLEVIADRIAAVIAISPSAVLESLRPMIADARQGAQRVRDIVRGLKVFSRGSEKRTARIDVRGPLDAAIGIARNEIRHRAQLTLALEPTPFVLADEGRLAQLFLNLLINAAQCIPEGAAATHAIGVTLGVSAEGWVRIEVSDTGAGISREVLSRIFDPFFTTKPIGVGTGLGLSICHAIATEIGGRIEVESVEGRGTTFRVLLPAAEAGG